MKDKITMGELKQAVYESDSEVFEPLKRLFAFNDYKKTHEGQENPFCDDKMVLGDLE